MVYRAYLQDKEREYDRMTQAGDIIENYHLVRYLGGGGQGEVWLGNHAYLPRQAAIKLIKLNPADEEEKDKYLREARLTAQLDHPNIIKVWESGVLPGILYLALVYAPDGTLRRRHPEKTRVPLPTISKYVEQIAAGLQYAHDRGLNHLDVKPSNLLISPKDEIWLSDFGIARVVHSESSLHAKSGNSQGWTLGYAAPEQLTDSPTAASDQYSLAVVVYEWICGHRPFSGVDPSIILQQQREKHLSLKAEAPDLQLPDAVEQVVLKALSYHRGDRFLAVQDFAAELKRAISGPERFAISSQPTFHSGFSQAADPAWVSSSAQLPQSLPRPDPAIPTPWDPTRSPVQEPQIPVGPRTDPPVKQDWQNGPYVPPPPTLEPTEEMSPKQYASVPPLRPVVRRRRQSFARLQSKDLFFVIGYGIVDVLWTIPLAILLRNGNVWIGSLAIVIILRILSCCAIRKRLARMLVILPILYWPLGILSVLLLFHSQLFILVLLLGILSWFLQDYFYVSRKK